MKFIKRYLWLKKMGINKPFRAALDRNFIRGGSIIEW